MQRSHHPATSASPDLREEGSDEEELEDVEKETLAQLHTIDFDLEELIPPAVPLMPKEVLPQEPIRPAYNDPLLYLPGFPGDEPTSLQGERADKSTFPDPYPAEITLKKLFQDDLIYRRTSIAKFSKDAISAGFFNARLCDVKKLLIRAKMEERRNFEGTFPSVLTTDLPPFYRPRDASDPTLVFESRFESGNLESVARLTDTEYNLLLQNDINSKGHTQWFFFKVGNGRTGTRYKFNIINFVKPDSLFNSGMRVLLYSHKAFVARNIGWHRGGDNFLYYPNGLMRENSEKQHYTLTFTYMFQYSEDEVYFAYSFPYTYSQLTDYLDAKEADEGIQK